MWQDGSGEVRSNSLEEFRARFTRVVLLRSAAGRATRRAGNAAAINRAVVFALAYPDRFITRGEADAGARGDAAQFLAEAAGKLRDPVSLRWRQAAERLAAGEVDAALDRLYDAMLRGLGLPEPVYGALAQAADSPLTSLQRRELIYLARAGIRDLKVLAICRLASAARSTDVLHTLESLARTTDPFVRAAAARGLRG